MDSFGCVLTLFLPQVKMNLTNHVIRATAISIFSGSESSGFGFSGNEKNTIGNSFIIYLSLSFENAPPMPEKLLRSKAKNRFKMTRLATRTEARK